MSSIALGKFIPGDSVVHRLDPRSKLACTVILMCALLSASAVADYLVWIPLFYAITLLSKISFTLVLRSVRPVIFLALISAFINLFWTPGDVILSLGPMSITREGVIRAAAMSLRLCSIVMIAGIMMFTTNPMAISDAFERLFAPFARIGFPASEMAMMMTIALRFIPTLFEETDRIIKAQRSRGADLDTGGPIKKIRNYIPIFIPLFVLVFKRAENLAVAMEARSYVPGARRTKMHPLRWNIRDTIAVVICAAVGVAAVAADRYALSALVS